MTGTAPGLTHVRFFRWWLAVLFAATLAVGAALAVFTFSAVIFTALALLWLREPRGAPAERMRSRLSGAMLIVCAVWFYLNLFIELLETTPGPVRPEPYLLLMALAFIFTPVMVHLEYVEQCARSAFPSPAIRRLVRIYYPASAVFIVATLLVSSGIYGRNAGSAVVILQTAMFAMFLVAVGLAMASSAKSRKAGNTNVRLRRWHAAMFTVSILLFGFLIAALVFWSGTGVSVFHLSRLARCLPLFFFFIDTYYERRFTFFDIFVKRGSLVFLVMVTLVAYFRLVAPALAKTDLGRSGPWAYVLTLLPAVLLLPWLRRRLELWLDRVWLGRRFTTVEAVKYFLSGMQDATTERDLVSRAEERLSELFQAEASIGLAGAEDLGPEFRVAQQLPIRVHGEAVGALRMGERENQMPYFSADLALMASLADVFSSLLENVRLQIRKQEQDKKEQDLRLHASRSELKALRAQINPHFLFNTLNVIAGLIHKDPARAEETVEELAEVFRYTLKRSEKETVRLEEELDFVRTYLEIEKVRFGERLQVSIEVDPDLRQEVIPTMMIQTLVENAIKHGIAAVRGAGSVGIRVLRRSGTILLEVSDNGPGFPTETSVEREPRSGYGLRNLSQRLQAHYGRAAAVAVTREDGTTRVSLELPVTLREALSEQANADGPTS